MVLCYLFNFNPICIRLRGVVNKMFSLKFSCYLRSLNNLSLSPCQVVSKQEYALFSTANDGSCDRNPGSDVRRGERVTGQNWMPLLLRLPNLPER